MATDTSWAHLEGVDQGLRCNLSFVTVGTALFILATGAGRDAGERCHGNWRMTKSNDQSEAHHPGNPTFIMSVMNQALGVKWEK